MREGGVNDGSVVREWLRNGLKAATSDDGGGGMLILVLGG